MGHCLMDCDKYFKDILNSLYDGIYIFDLEGKITFWNKGMEHFTGIDQRLALDKKDLVRFVNEQDKIIINSKEILEKLFSEGYVRKKSAYIEHVADIRFPVLIKIVPIRDSEDEINGAVVSITDDTSRIVEVEKWKALAKLAFFDSVTNVNSRPYMEIKINDSIDHLKKDNKSFSLMALRLENLKEINKNFSHKTGDEALKLLANISLDNTGEKASVGRWESNILLVLLPDTPKGLLVLMANKINDFINKFGIVIGKDVIDSNISFGGLEIDKDSSLPLVINRIYGLLDESKESGRISVNKI